MTSRYPRKPDAGLTEADYGATLGEIARELGVSKGRARQIEAEALAKAKEILERWGCSLEDLLGEHSLGDPQGKEGFNITLLLQGLLDEERHG